MAAAELQLIANLIDDCLVEDLHALDYADFRRLQKALEDMQKFPL